MLTARRGNLLVHHGRVADVLAEVGLHINPRDEILLDGAGVTLSSALPAPRTAASGQAAKALLAATTPGEAIALQRPERLRLSLNRAIPVTLHDDQATSTFYTVRSTVGEAILEQGITLYLGDRVMPESSAPLAPGTHIFIERSVPVTLLADGQIIHTRTQHETVAEVLAEEGLALMGQDFSRPAADQPVSPNDTIQIVRVRELSEIEQELIAFETTWVPDETMEIDRQQVRQKGGSGVIKTRSRVRYENGQEVWRRVEDEWLDQLPSDRVIAYGTKIVVRTVETEDGPIEYWRKIPMLATAYNASTSGKSSDHPQYGITRSGLTAAYGIVAVDPKVIPLMTDLYVADYGPALAGDTGGSILGKHIDLGHEDGIVLPVIYEWRDVYVLTPVPPADRIRYVLPQWPQR